MNVIRHTTHTIAFATGTSRNGREIRMQCRTHSVIQQGQSFFRTEDHVNQNKRERQGHRLDNRSGLQPSPSLKLRTWGDAPGWYRIAPAALRKSLSLHARAASLLLALVPTLATAQTPQSTSHQQLRIRILNAKTNKPITDEKLNVALRVDQIGSVAMPTDKYGIVTVDIGSATIIRILSNMYADCRPRAELYTNYPITDILHTGITTGNLCSALTHRPTPGELLLFEIPRTSVPVSPQPPATNLPHSDEYPQ